MSIELMQHIEQNILEINEGIGSAAGTIAGKIGEVGAHFTKEKRDWLHYVDQEDRVRVQIKRNPNNINLKKKLKFIVQDKTAARERYLKVKDKFSATSSSVTKKAVHDTINVSNRIIGKAKPKLLNIHNSIVANNRK